MFGSKKVWAAALVAVAGLVSLSCNKDEKDDEKGGGAVISIFAVPCFLGPLLYIADPLIIRTTLGMKHLSKKGTK